MFCNFHSNKVRNELSVSLQYLVLRVFLLVQLLLCVEGDKPRGVSSYYRKLLQKSCQSCLIKIIFHLRINSYLFRGHSSEQSLVRQLGGHLGGWNIVSLPNPNLLTQVRAKQRCCELNAEQSFMALLDGSPHHLTASCCN